MELCSYRVRSKQDRPVDTRRLLSTSVNGRPKGSRLRTCSRSMPAACAPVKEPVLIEADVPHIPMAFFGVGEIMSVRAPKASERHDNGRGART